MELQTNTGDYPFIKNGCELEVYIEILKTKYEETELQIEMRYPAFTYNDGMESVIAIIPHKILDYTFLVPYFRLRSHVQGPREDSKSLMEVVGNGLLREVGWSANYAQEIGVIEVKNSIPDVTEPHRKHVVAVLDYEKDISEYAPSSKIGRGIWVHNEVLGSIFEKVTPIDGTYKKHPQLRAYYIMCSFEKRAPLV